MITRYADTLTDFIDACASKQAAIDSQTRNDITSLAYREFNFNKLRNKAMTKDYYGTKKITAWEQEKDDKPGYAVKYADGYISWSPKEVFEEAYKSNGFMTFDHAIAAMRAGYRVSRSGWNGKGMWICQGEGNISLDAAKFWNKHTKAFAEQNGGVAEVLPYFIMKTTDNKILMGWLASQSDMAANDWGVIE